MEFAINWSPQARDLQREGLIQIDRYKCPDWDGMIADARQDAPVYVHFPLVVGKQKLADTHWARIDAYMRDTNTPHVNLHLEPTRSALGDIDDDTVIDLCMREVQSVVDRYGGDCVVLENVPYRAFQSDKYRAAILPQKINWIIRATGCRMLLDIGHARISAEALEMSPFAYMNELPFDRLGEVHIAGVTTYTRDIHERAMQHDGYEAIMKKYEGADVIGWNMDHFGMESDADWHIFEWVLRKIQRGEAAEPRFIAFEYGGTGAPFAWRSERDVIARDVPRFYGMVHGVMEKP